MAFLRVLLLIAGIAFALFGTFFALQGAGIIMWPAESFMLANGDWVTYGVAIALTGILLVWLSRRISSSR